MAPMRMARIVRRVRTGFPGIAALLLCLGAGSARAEMVLLSSTTLVSGTESASFSFDAPGPGTVEAQVANLDWPQPLTSLNFLATTGNQVLSSWSNQSSLGGPNWQTLYFQVRPGTYFADVLASAGGPLDLGLWSLSLTFTPAAVPLPSSLALLLAGLVGFALLLRQARLRQGRRAAA